MPVLQTVLNQLNSAFGGQGLHALAANRDAFAPGKPLGAGLVVQKGTPLYNAWQDYLGQLPGSFQETLRSIIHYALSTAPPTPITFAWAPSYDYELTIWHAPDTPTTKGGISVLIKSRYPNDKHPLTRTSP
jgi:hypothetical protein